MMLWLWFDDLAKMIGLMLGPWLDGYGLDMK